MNIRPLIKDDANLFLQLLLQIDNETSFMLYDKGERNTTTKEMVNRIESINKNGIIYVVEYNTIFVGFILVQNNPLNKIKHIASIVIGVLKAYSGKGLATQLIQQVEQWCVANGIRRIELTTMAHNTRAIALYKKMGFEIEGIRRKAIQMNGIFYDDIYMGKLLN